jgi:hypothetical protein
MQDSEAVREHLNPGRVSLLGVLRVKVAQTVYSSLPAYTGPIGGSTNELTSGEEVGQPLAVDPAGNSSLHLAKSAL